MADDEDAAGAYFTCRVAACGKLYSGAQGLKQHLVNHHGDEDVGAIYAEENRRTRTWRQQNPELTQKVLEQNARKRQSSTAAPEWARKKAKDEQEVEEEEEEEEEEDEEEDEEEESVEEEAEPLYCYCQKPYDNKRFMIACDGCDEWFHAGCLGTTDTELDAVDVYFCAECRARDRYLGIRFKDRPATSCAAVGCEGSAGDHSRYCSHQCGLVTALLRARHIIRSLRPSADLMTAAMPRSDAAPGSPCPPAELAVSAESPEPAMPALAARRVASHVETVECRVCGLMSGLRGYPRHVHACYLKVEELNVAETGRRYLQPVQHAADARRLLKDTAPCGYVRKLGAEPCAKPRSLCMQHFVWHATSAVRTELRAAIQRQRQVERDDAQWASEIAWGQHCNPYNAVFHSTSVAQ